ncbi:PREDICTED: trypsin delta/gamma-like [Ceratosolen solmsi marchali]|uniref:Trypsin delta/gamma-like n=1 Tax=Ceratosolen solmsi marchali TaxID=326594 RepID=A0AAJ6YNW8_9HYME|nr:PREDICTED: trypsin delta/gamma-like [Ceratosolen solmsi marchali]
MNLKIYPFINQYVILSNFYGFLIASPIIGSNVRQANSDEFPSIVSLMDIREGIEDVEELHFCTGALLTNTHVLTAAHCLEDTLKNETQIVIGSRDLRCGQIFYPLWWVDYNQWAVFQNVQLRFRVNDIAIIKLSQCVPNNITPLPLSTAKNIYLYGLNVVAAGWGISNNGEVTRIMETVNLRILSNADCEVRIASANGRRIPVHERLLCSISEPFAVMQAIQVRSRGQVGPTRNPLDRQPQGSVNNLTTVAKARDLTREKGFPWLCLPSRMADI